MRHEPHPLHPWNLHRDLVNDFSRFLDRSPGDDSSGATADWAPPVDIEEYPDRFVIYADVPGVDPASIDVTLDEGVLTLSGNRQAADEPVNIERRRRERAAGRFHRRFTLPDTADAEAVTASGRLGVLEVHIPKRPQAQPRRITVTQ